MREPAVVAAEARDFLINQDWASYSRQEHALWGELHARQSALLQGRACEAFTRGLEALDLNAGGAPDFAAINPRLQALTGWRVAAVAGLVPDAVFFDLLSRRIFPAARFLRRREQIDYLAEPDLFHDVFGHVPMLTDPTFAGYTQAYGAGGLRALGLDHLNHLARLYWYTVEFGLLRTQAGVRIYGAGIVSSHAETLFALESRSPNRLGFELVRTMRTRYRIDDFQQTYFVVPSLAALLEATLQDFAPVYAALQDAADLAPDAVLPTDEALQIGDQSHARGRRPQ